MSEFKQKVPITIVLLFVILVAGCAREQDPTPTPGVSDSRQSPVAADTRATGVARETGLPDVGALADAGSGPEPTPPPQVYAVQAGDTLYAIAARFGCDLDDLIQANQIANPSALQVGQQLKIPATAIETSPAINLLPNSEFVNSPAYVDFDTAAFANRQRGYLSQYQERVNGEPLSGPEIVDRVARHYSVGPRLLLAILEQESSWVTNPSPAGQALSFPLGYRGGGWESFQGQLAWAADKLNEGYYDWRGRGMAVKIWQDGSTTRYAPTLNAATAGLQYFYSLNATQDEWRTLVGEGPGSFIQTYRKLFGDPAQYAIEPLIPANTVCPPLTLPWPKGEVWFYTGGPHGGWNEGSAWAAIDVVPNEGYLGCRAASAWATAAASGLVIYSDEGEVLIDLDEDGHQETGWVLFYLHVATQDRVPVGDYVKQGDPIGHPSCEGGFSESTHLHLARLYNGEWIAADGPLPLILSGWQFFSEGIPYNGTAVRGGQQRAACECWDVEFNGLEADR